MGGATPAIVRFTGTGGGLGAASTGLAGAGFGGAGAAVAGFTGAAAGRGAAAAPAAPGAAGNAAAPGFVTRNECPHFGQRILRPAGGTRRSSIWYGALQDSHSTLSIDRTSVSRRARTTRFRGRNGGRRVGSNGPCAGMLAAVIDDRSTYDAQLEARAASLTTLCVHAGDLPDPTSRALEAPLVLSSAFGFADAEQAAGAFQGTNDGYIYGRWANPTVEALEAKVAALEGTPATCATASGMAAVSGAVLAFCAQGDHVVAPRSMYAESARLLRERLPRFGIETTFVDATDVAAYERALRPSTRVLYIETPANPNLAISDVAAIVALARARGAMTIADNTFATPFAQSPQALGVDLVVHSMTKALGGHGDAIGGCVCGPEDHVARVRDLVVKGFGGVLSPFAAFLIARGLRTFALRQRQQCATAAFLASRLATHPDVAVVHHPSLPSHPGHALAGRQMHAYGALLSFELHGRGRVTALEAGKRVLEGVKTITHAVSLGDVRSLIVHPASTTHSTMPAEARAAAHISDGLLRLSVGLESAGDLWTDLQRALG
jgi:methionine-gamma-lyase